MRRSRQRGFDFAPGGNEPPISGMGLQFDGFSKSFASGVFSTIFVKRCS